jgi:hypothetical protein
MHGYHIQHALAQLANDSDPSEENPDEGEDLQFDPFHIIYYSDSFDFGIDDTSDNDDVPDLVNDVRCVCPVWLAQLLANGGDPSEENPAEGEDLSYDPFHVTRH